MILQYFVAVPPIPRIFRWVHIPHPSDWVGRLEEILSSVEARNRKKRKGEGEGEGMQERTEDKAAYLGLGGCHCFTLIDAFGNRIH